MQNRYIATFILHATLDMIGFKNGEWEFNFGKKELSYQTTLELVYDFIALGGIIGIDFGSWLVSDDTIFHIAIGNAVLKLGREFEEFDDSVAKIFRDEMYKSYLQILRDSEMHKQRAMGVATEKYIKKFHTDKDGRHLQYDETSGGNGAAMRNSCIGLAFFGEDNRDKLIEMSIQSSRMTHNSAIGYLAGLNVALFIAYAIEGIMIEKWPSLFVDLLESEKFRKYLENLYDELNEEMMDDIDNYIMHWRKYIDIKFNKNIIVRSKVQNNLVFRSKFYYENFTKNTPAKSIGYSGYCAMIMAYDCLLDSGDKWETLVVYSALHYGDSDTVGAIAGSLYGAVYGFHGVPESNYVSLEFKNDLLKLGKDFYSKFYEGNPV